MKCSFVIDVIFIELLDERTGDQDNSWFPRNIRSSDKLHWKQVSHLLINLLGKEVVVQTSQVFEWKDFTMEKFKYHCFILINILSNHPLSAIREFFISSFNKFAHILFFVFNKFFDHDDSLSFFFIWLCEVGYWFGVIIVFIHLLRCIS